MEITYSKYGDYYLPDLVLSEEEPATYGRFGRIRLKYLKEHRRVLYINLLTSGELTQHLNEVDRQAREMLELLVKQMAQEQGITEQMKAEDQMAWVGAMNNIRSAAEEVVMQTSVYKGYKQDKIEMRGDRAEMSDFPLYLNTVAGGLDCRDQTIGGFSFVVKIYAVPVVEIIG